MKPVPLAALVLLAFAAFGDEKPAVSPHAFRMPKKTVVQPAPEAPVAESEPVVPVAEEAPKAIEPSEGSQLPPTAFQFPKPAPSVPEPELAPEPKQQPKAETAKPAKPLPFVLPGQKPAPVSKKTPVIFRLPRKTQQ